MSYRGRWKAGEVERRIPTRQKPVSIAVPPHMRGSLDDGYTYTYTERLRILDRWAAEREPLRLMCGCDLRQLQRDRLYDQARRRVPQERAA